MQSQNRSCPQVKVKRKHVSNHHLVKGPGSSATLPRGHVRTYPCPGSCATLPTRILWKGQRFLPYKGSSATLPDLSVKNSTSLSINASLPCFERFEVYASERHRRPWNGCLPSARLPTNLSITMKIASNYQQKSCPPLFKEKNAHLLCFDVWSFQETQTPQNPLNQIFASKFLLALWRGFPRGSKGCWVETPSFYYSVPVGVLFLKR